MNKNSAVVTAMLDQNERSQQLHLRILSNPLVDDGTIDQWEASLDEGGELFQACLDAGWTVAELDAAYERRFGRKVNRKV